MCFTSGRCSSISRDSSWVSVFVVVMAVALPRSNAPSLRRGLGRTLGVGPNSDKFHACNFDTPRCVTTLLTCDYVAVMSGLGHATHRPESFSLILWITRRCDQWEQPYAGSIRPIRRPHCAGTPPSAPRGGAARPGRERARPARPAPPPPDGCAGPARPTARPGRPPRRPPPPGDPCDPSTVTSRLPPRRPRTSTRTAPGPPSGWGGRSMGSRAVRRSRRVAASRAVTRCHAGEGGHQHQRVGQGGAVAVLGADRVREPAQLASAARRVGAPSPRRASRAPCRRAPDGAGGRRPARRFRPWPRAPRPPRRSRPRPGRPARRSARERSRRPPPPSRRARGPRCRGRAGPARRRWRRRSRPPTGPGRRSPAGQGAVVAGRAGQHHHVGLDRIGERGQVDDRALPQGSGDGLEAGAALVAQHDLVDALGGQQLARHPGPDRAHAQHRERWSSGGAETAVRAGRRRPARASRRPGAACRPSPEPAAPRRWRRRSPGRPAPGAASSRDQP